MLRKILKGISKFFNNLAISMAERELTKAFEKYKQKREQLRRFEPSFITDESGLKFIKWTPRPAPLDDKEVDEAMKIMPFNML